jgi:hypothetical protein
LTPLKTDLNRFLALPSPDETDHGVSKKLAHVCDSWLGPESKLHHIDEGCVNILKTEFSFEVRVLKNEEHEY